MHTSFRARARRWLAGGATLAVAGVGVAVPVTAAPAAAAPAAPATATPASYLALGDSVAFGYVPANAVPAPNYADAASFVGYPEDLARALQLKVVNASCPGETTVSMIAAGGLSNGCENSPKTPYGYRTFYPLHTTYTGTQLGYAVHFLKAHPSVSLVTINIGANDAFVCQETTADHCTSGPELIGVLNQIKLNLRTIYAALRTEAGYTGKIVALSYYSLSYSDPLQVGQAEILNGTIGSVTRAYGGIVANGFGAFKAASKRTGGDPCVAGLLIKLPDGTCNIHPSPAGHLLLASALATAIRG